MDAGDAKYYQFRAIRQACSKIVSIALVEEEMGRLLDSRVGTGVEFSAFSMYSLDLTSGNMSYLRLPL